MIGFGFALVVVLVNVVVLAKAASPAIGSSSPRHGPRSPVTASDPSDTQFERKLTTLLLDGTFFILGTEMKP